MGLFDILFDFAKDKVKDLAQDKAFEAAGGFKNKIFRSSKDNNDSDVEDDEELEYDEELDDDVEDEDVEEDDEEDVEYEVVDDEDFDELNEMVDDAISDGELDEDDEEELYERASELGLDMDEFQEMIDARLRQIQESIEEGYDRDYYYRTRSVWRRCPNCGHLVLVDDDVCDWCGYQLRTHPVASAIALGLMAACSSETKKIKRDKAVRKAAAKKVGIRKSASKNKPKSLVNKTTSATPKKSLFGKSLSEKVETPKKKTLFGSDSSKATKVTKKKTIFGGDSSKTAKAPKKKSLFGSSSKSEKKSGGLFGTGTKKKSGGLFGGAMKKSGGLLGGGRKRR